MKGRAVNVVLLLASLCVLGYAAGARSQRTAIDRSFLDDLNTMPPAADPPLAYGARERFDHLAFEHEDGLVYLVRRSDPEAVRAMLRCVVHDLSFGGCACTRGGTIHAAFRDGPGPVFWAELSRLPAREQAGVIVAVSRAVSGDIDEGWSDNVAAFLASRPAVAERVAMAAPQLLSVDGADGSGDH